MKKFSVLFQKNFYVNATLLGLVFSENSSLLPLAISLTTFFGLALWFFPKTEKPRKISGVISLTPEQKIMLQNEGMQKIYETYHIENPRYKDTFRLKVKDENGFLWIVIFQKLLVPVLDVCKSSILQEEQKIDFIALEENKGTKPELKFYSDLSNYKPIAS